MNEGYTFRLLTLGDEEFDEMSRLLRLVFPSANHLTPRYLRWQYAGNPDGRAVGCNAYWRGRLVGHMAATPMAGMLEGESRGGLFLMNGAVHPEHRGRRLQSGISASIFEEAASLGYAYCFGTGNRYSTGPLLTRFRLLKPLDARIGLGLPRRSSSPRTPSFERVWSEAAMRWRLANPEREYWISRERRRTLVTAPSGVPGIAAILDDRPGEAAEPTRRRVPGPLRLWLGLDPQVLWARSAFVAIPEALRPSPLNLVFKDLTGGNHLPDPEGVLFRAIDFDAY